MMYVPNPKNKYGYGTQEYWDQEIKLSGLSREEYFKMDRERSPKCPHCGIPKGYAMGTGDCGCCG